MKRGSTKHKAHPHLVSVRLKVEVGPHNTVLTQQTRPTMHSPGHSLVSVGGKCQGHHESNGQATSD